MYNIKRCISLFIIIALVFSLFSVSSLAHDDKRESQNKQFRDLPKEHWAYEDVVKMVELGVIGGYTDGSFKPSKEVTRAEFAKMMVLVLDLPLINADEPSFEDVAVKDWEYCYVETAKHYLTGFRTSNGDCFKPDQYAVREDMAVALVNALELNVADTNLAILNEYKDRERISTNLEKYVATSIKHKIMVGSDNKFFYPQGNLTRAQAASLLSRLIDEEKVTYDEEKVTYDDDETQPPSTDLLPNIKAEVTDTGIRLTWDKVNDKDFKYYKIVVSKNNANPKYPDDGYLAYISNINQTNYFVSPYAKYNKGDIGGSIQPEGTYYFSVTAVHENHKTYGNAIKLTMPAKNTNVDYHVSLKGEKTDKGVELYWDEAKKEEFKYYKVVISKHDATPIYPENGYMFYYSDRAQISTIITTHDKYHNGDFGNYLQPGESYYFSITAVYNHGKYPSNVIKLTY